MSIADTDYIRVVEQFPQILALDPARDLPLIIALAYSLGITDGISKCNESLLRENEARKK